MRRVNWLWFVAILGAVLLLAGGAWYRWQMQIYHDSFFYFATLLGGV